MKKATVIRNNGKWSLVALLLALSVPACKDPIQMEIPVLPRFTCYARKFPPARQWETPPPPWGQDAPYIISMYDFVARFTGQAPAGQNIQMYQRVAVTGWTAFCGRPAIPYQYVRFESAPLPSIDLHTNYKDAEQRVFSRRDMISGFAPVPNGPAGGGYLEPAYFAALGPAAAQALKDTIERNHVFHWDAKWSYDGCNRPPDRIPMTFCRKMHCLSMAKQSRGDPGGSYGDWSEQSFEDNCGR